METIIIVYRGWRILSVQSENRDLTPIDTTIILESLKGLPLW